MSTPRNRLAYERGQAIKEEIRTLLESRSQIQPLWTAEDIQLRLSRHLALRTIRLYMQQFRDESLVTLPLR